MPSDTAIADASASFEFRPRLQMPSHRLLTLLVPQFAMLGWTTGGRRRWLGAPASRFCRHRFSLFPFNLSIVNQIHLLVYANHI